jgi:multiple sugar transport system substrate-binding protein
MAIVLAGLGWDHPRCMLPMWACAKAWLRETGVRVKWHARSLEAFGDQPLEEVARNYDLLVIDHPFCGAASRSGCLRPLDEILDPAALDTVCDGAIGPSQLSYAHEGHVWALAADAACQVSVFSAALDRGAPETWAAALELTRDLGHRAALPLAPAHAISSLLTLWAAAGLDPLSAGGLVDPEQGVAQIEWLAQASAVGHPSATSWEPPDALAALTAGELDYIPLTYGYSSYAGRAGEPAVCRFADIPGTRGAVLGGAGLAVSAWCAHPSAAARFAAWVCSAEVQRTIVAPAGGQPASAACWSDAVLDAGAGGFYSATAATMRGAWVRPRTPWWPAFQLHAGRLLTQALIDREPPERVMRRLSDLHDRQGAPSPP